MSFLSVYSFSPSSHSSNGFFLSPLSSFPPNFHGDAHAATAMTIRLLPTAIYRSRNGGYFWNNVMRREQVMQREVVIRRNDVMPFFTERVVHALFPIKICLSTSENATPTFLVIIASISVADRCLQFHHAVPLDVARGKRCFLIC